METSVLAGGYKSDVLSVVGSALGQRLDMVNVLPFAVDGLAVSTGIVGFVPCTLPCISPEPLMLASFLLEILFFVRPFFIHVWHDLISPVVFTVFDRTEFLTGKIR